MDLVGILGEKVEVVERVEEGKGRGSWKVYGGNDGRIVEEERYFRGKEVLPMGSTWRLISWLTVWFTPAAPYKMAVQERPWALGLQGSL